MRAASLVNFSRKKGKEQLRHCLDHSFRFRNGQLDFFAVILRIGCIFIWGFGAFLKVVGIYAAFVAAIAVDVYVAVDVDGYVHG
jgi:hypothetical protein